jgi:hypothetical protein
MPLLNRLTWRRRIRAVLRDTDGDLASILAYAAKHPTEPFLDPGTLAAIVIVRNWITAKLAQRTFS